MNDFEEIAQWMLPMFSITIMFLAFMVRSLHRRVCREIDMRNRSCDLFLRALNDFADDMHEQIQVGRPKSWREDLLKDIASDMHIDDIVEKWRDREDFEREAVRWSS